MRSLVSMFLFVILIVTKVAGQETRPLTTFILVRHAEKDNDGTSDPELSSMGKERAKKLVSLFKDTPIDAIFSTNYKRTLSTAEPLVNAKGVNVVVYQPKHGATIDEMLNKYGGKTIVLVGHSNTIPWTANYLLGKEQYNDFADEDYDNILIVTVCEKGKTATSVWLNY
ncbi:SixA phosphatase family protein [Chryseosolibacter indicus]|uniref:Histidine phosphatase family protein n=1 Tax=Chryseosolibacter indicus TaxID=2782351 RepID=A0ABS5VLM5_9BACT|nr:phosphoglycerate mutase family protein [Chryseosolibacter indicus]MBT1702276.1 histidine phosphatase family protein [Chryseosolibacter indicus]